jgi:hypothetical protein
MNVHRTTRYAAALAAGLLCLAQATPASAGSPPHHRPGWHHSQHHGRHYHGGPRYVVVDRLPHGCRHVYYRGQPYYYRGSDWYQPYGVRFVAVAPPAGVIIDGRGVTLVGQVPLVRW